MPVYERGKAPDGQPHAGRHPGQRGEKRDRFQTRLREQAVADPQRVEDARLVGRDADVEQIFRLDRADDDGAIREDEAVGGPDGRRHDAFSRSVMRLKN
jgi:hypothetical protein